MEKWQINTTVIALILLHLGTASATGKVIYEYKLNESLIHECFSLLRLRLRVFCTGPLKCWTVFDQPVFLSASSSTEQSATGIALEQVIKLQDLFKKKK